MIYRQKRRHRKVFWSAVWPNVVLWFFKILSANINKGGSFHFSARGWRECIPLPLRTDIGYRPAHMGAITNCVTSIVFFFI